MDSSALVAGILSDTGGARAILSLAEGGKIRLVLLQQVVVESRETLLAKAPALLDVYVGFIERIEPETCPAASIAENKAAAKVISDPDDAPILAAAILAKPDYLVSLDRKHFLASGVAEATGLRIGTPGDCLLWLQIRLEQAQE